jgi:indole-3-glycerol phosphate synthase
VEAHDGAELERALAIDSRVVGVNARDLGTFDEDLGLGEQLVESVPADVVVVAESAIRSRGDAERMAKAGFDAVLVGEMLVTSADPTAAVRELASVPRRPRR